MKTLALVGCGAKKASERKPARELYTSTLFRLSLAYAEQLTPNVRIVSAKHGLLDLDTVIEPYELRLSEVARPQRAGWGEAVADHVHALFPQKDRVVLLCGEEYASVLRDPLGKFGALIQEPLAGLQIGERMQWLKAETAKLSSPAPAQPALAVDDVRKALGFATQAQAQASRVRPDVIAHALDVLSRAAQRNVPSKGGQLACETALSDLRKYLTPEAP